VKFTFTLPLVEDYTSRMEGGEKLL
jgi:hypothetical protein